jgi:hypothetical protein
MKTRVRLDESHLPCRASAAPSIIDFISDRHLLGPHFDGPSWDRWRAVMRALFALPMSSQDVALFREVAERDPPKRPVSEFVAVVGRGGGKDAIASALATFIATTGDLSRLRPGERATVLCIANDRDQATIACNYIKGYFDNIPMLRGMVKRMTPDTIELTNGASILVATNSFLGVRGRTICCAIYDEVAFWRSDEYANPDVEVDAAVTPGLMRWPGSVKIMISSAYRRAGLFFGRYKRSYAVNDNDTLVVLGDSLKFNPTLDAQVIERELALDYQRASAEYLCRWRDDLVAFIDRDAVLATVTPGCRERGHMPGTSYVGFCDPSGGRADSMTLAIAHADRDGTAVLDLVREIKPPFSPVSAVHEFAAALKSYRLNRVTGDAYGAEWVGEQFREHGITYQTSPVPRSDLYRELLPLINSSRASLLDNDRLINQLCALERRVARSGQDSINHPDGGHDDLINSAAGALTLVAGKRRMIRISDAALARARMPLPPRWARL